MVGTDMNLAILFLLFIQPSEDPPRPILTKGDRGLFVVLPESILQDPEVSEQLASGLTNTFRILVGGSSPRDPLGGTRIEIRYELWDEVFLIRVLEGDGNQFPHRVESPEALRAWWTQKRFLLIPREIPTGLSPLSLTLEFIPFSRSEQDSAREWLSKSTTRTPTRIDEGAAAQAQVTSIFKTIMATSIKRKPLLRYRWRLSELSATDQ